MATGKTPKNRRESDRPAPAGVDWEDLATSIESEDIEDEEVDPLDDPGDGDDLDEDDDDNPYQDSDEALPDDEEESAISRKLRRDGEAG